MRPLQIILAQLALIGLSIVFIVHISSYTPQYKSDMRDVGGEMAQRLHSGDLVIVSQPEQVPLAWYYLPNGRQLQYASTLGRVPDPRYMNWVFALRRLRNSNPQATIAPLIGSLRPGQQVLFVRPLTEGAKNWQASWTPTLPLARTRFNVTDAESSKPWRNWPRPRTLPWLRRPPSVILPLDAA